MSTQVQQVLDTMVEPLQDLQARNIFSLEEIHAIVDRRRDYEYRLRRSDLRKADYLQYIEDEILLEQLRRVRTKTRRGDVEDNENQSITQHIGDRHIRDLITILWKRTLRRFRSDPDVYERYETYLQENNGHSTLSLFYTDVLAMFPRQPEWWIKAASHELFQLRNVTGARVLMQRSLRINASEPDLWLQYFVLELHIEQKMEGRRQLLELKSNQDDDEKKDATTPSYELVRLVHDNAVKAIPNNEQMRISMWRNCQLFPQTVHLQKHILKNLRVQCGDNPHAWIAAAAASGQSANGSNDDPPPTKKRKKVTTAKDAVIDTLTEAISRIPKADMFLETVRFLRKSEEKTKMSESRIQFIREVFQKASSEQQTSVDLVLEQLHFLGDQGELKAGLQAVSQYVDQQTVADARVWVQWAHMALLANPTNLRTPLDILQRGLVAISIASTDHYLTVLLQSFGAQLALEVNKKKKKARNNKNHHRLSLEETWNKILLLAPGNSTGVIASATVFGVTSVADACVQYLYQLLSTGADLSKVRHVYRAVLHQSSLLDSLDEKDESEIAMYREFCDKVIDLEEEQSRKRAVLETAVKRFSSVPEIGKEYQQQLEDVTYGFVMKALSIDHGPISFEFDQLSSRQIVDFYEKHQVIHLRNVRRTLPTKTNTFHWRDIHGLFLQLKHDDQKSWCIEKQSSTLPTPSEFLLPLVTGDRAYCSFLVQKDRKRYQHLLGCVPFSNFSGADWEYEEALWLFFGRNPPGQPRLPGRDDHTDSVSHDGTWHYQLSGTKDWFIRPTQELTRLTTDHKHGNDTKIHLSCREGDVLLINTRLWFHRTEIPPQAVPSVSYARDVRWKIADDSSMGGGMANVDGLYATEIISADTVIFTEHDMPGCELHHSSTNPNCYVGELPDGTSAVVALRDIAQGEFFCVAESDDDDGNDDGITEDD